MMNETFSVIFKHRDFKFFLRIIIAFEKNYCIDKVHFFVDHHFEKKITKNFLSKIFTKITKKVSFFSIFLLNMMIFFSLISIVF